MLLSLLVASHSTEEREQAAFRIKSGTAQHREVITFLQRTLVELAIQENQQVCSAAQVNHFNGII